MPITEARRAYMREYQRRRRAEAKQAAKFELVIEAPDDPLAALLAWCSDVLRVPVGHPSHGQPYTLPPFGVAFLKDALTARESLLSIARKNSKSGIVAALVLAYLVGPLRVPGFRCGVASVTREKSGELKAQIEALALASGLAGELKFFRSPAPGRIESATGSVDLLASDAGAHASGYDLAIFDELGLVPESKRDFVASLRSSVSAKRGRFLALSIWGPGPFVAEMVERQHHDGVAVHLHQAPDGCALDDEAAWHAANPGLVCRIKSIDHMRHEAARVLATPADQSYFLSHELNRPQDPAKVPIVGVAEWSPCVVGDAPRTGRCVVGLDLGGSSAMTCLVALWESGRCECFAAFPGVPTLLERGQHDGVGGLYQEQYDAGELWVYPGRVTPVDAFLQDCLLRLEGETVLALGTDRYRKAEAIQAFEGAGLTCPVVWRGTGASATADGSFDVRSFQARVLRGGLCVVRGRSIMTHAVSLTSLRFDGAGNPALHKQKSFARVDAVQAATIACGLAALAESENRATPLRVVVAG